MSGRGHRSDEVTALLRELIPGPRWSPLSADVDDELGRMTDELLAKRVARGERR